METIIQDASKGSPILAYGSASSSPKQKMVKIAAAILLVIALPVLIVTAIFFTGSGELPSSTLLRISFSPAHLNSKFSGALVKELPAPWRAAIETDTSFPVIIGLAKTDKGEPAPFAIIPRIVSISAPEGTRMVKSGLFKTILSSSITTEKLPYRSFVGILHARNGSDAGWMVNTDILQMISGERMTEGKTSEVYGSLTGSRGVILLPTEGVEGENESGAFFARIGKQDSDSAVVSESLRSQGISVRDLKDPDWLLLKGEGTLTAQWSDLDDAGRAMLAVAEGNTTDTVFELPDKDSVRQIVPDQSNASGTSNQLIISTAWQQSNAESDGWKTSCPGNVRFTLHGEVFQNLLILFRASPAWREKIHSFAISSNQGKNIFCVNE